MALIFSSGGGRLGNQILNLIHLIALSIEYNIDIFKLNDPFLTSKNKSFLFKVERNNINWHINNNSRAKVFLYLILQKIIIRCLHLYFYISPFGNSYKIGSKKNYPKLIFGRNLRCGFSINNLIKESRFSNVVISGWGLRDWDLVIKHKKKIVGYVTEGIKNCIKNKSCKINDYLLVHIRRSDFLEVSEYKALNFNDKIWIKSILNLCEQKSIKNVVIFSDSNINKGFISSLKDKEINVFIPETSNNNSEFFEIFFNYVFNASLVICNSSSLVLSISFLSHDNVYLPSTEKYYQKVSLNNAHMSFPTILNWN